MKLEYLDEPELEFGGLRRHIDIRQGLTLFGPLDADAERPRRIRLGLVGTQQTVDGIVQWLERCRSGVAAKASRQPNLFPAFPGFGAESAFRTDFDIDQSLVRALSSREVARLAALSHYTALAEAEQVLEGEVQAISEKARPDVVIVALPAELVALEDEEEVESTAEFASEKDQFESLASDTFQSKINWLPSGVNCSGGATSVSN